MRDQHKFLKQKEVDRALFWYEVRLYLKVALIVGAPFALILWVLLKWADRW